MRGQSARRTEINSRVCMACQYTLLRGCPFPMPRRKSNLMGYRLMGRPQTAPRQSWRKTIVAEGLIEVPDGTICDATPTPGRTYTRYTWPPRGRGRGESLTSPRRIEAKLRTVEV